MQNVSIFAEMLTTGRTSSKNSQKFVCMGEYFLSVWGEKKNSAYARVRVGVCCVKGLSESQFCVHVCVCACMCVFSTVPEGGC